MIPAEEDSLIEKSGKETVEESPARHCYPRVTVHMPKTVPSEEQRQRLHTVGEPDFTKSPTKSLNR